MIITTLSWGQWIVILLLPIVHKIIWSKRGTNCLVSFNSFAVVSCIQREVTQTQLVYTVMASKLELESSKELFFFLPIYVGFDTITVISGQLMSDNERLCAVEPFV